MSRRAPDSIAGPIAVALDDLLRHQDGPRILEQLRRITPTGLLDQADAAAADTETAVDRAADLTGAGKAWAPVTAYPPWVTLGATSSLAAWTLGRATTCLHSPTAERPQPVVGAAWKPNLIVCANCEHLLALRRGSTADRRCDGCGHLTAGVDAGDPIWPVTVAFGLLTWSAGVCRGCRWWPDTDPDNPNPA